ncbi:hypothetical protein AMTR_s00138p00027500 [Amborella trichopoda]|uniref:RRM domain-containing protein n=2 Tax=Amborella trichopoda TaxID=13333 RepID=W1NEJ0_AMBTC|nr:hypothetical protein AMTR_s00138p00027500 [Amborella trichopoda]
MEKGDNGVQMFLSEEWTKIMEFKHVYTCCSESYAVLEVKVCCMMACELASQIPLDHSVPSMGMEFPLNQTSNWTIDVSDVRTVKVSNISLRASQQDIKEFFSFSGDIQYVEMQRESEGSQLAYVTFKDSQGADTAILLSGATIADLSVTIAAAENYQLPLEALPPPSANESTLSGTAGAVIKKAEDVVSSMLAKGFVLGKDALSKAKAFDEKIHLTSNVASLDRKIGLSEKLSIGTAAVNEKVREMDEKFQVYEKTKLALAAAEQKVTDAGSAIMSNRYVSTGASWVTGALNRVAKAAEDVSLMTKEKVGKAEEEKMDTISRQRTDLVDEFARIHLADSPREATLAVHSTDELRDVDKLGII